MENHFLAFHNAFSSGTPHIGLLERIYQKKYSSFLLKEIRTHPLVFRSLFSPMRTNEDMCPYFFCLYFLSFYLFSLLLFNGLNIPFTLLTLFFLTVLRRILSFYLFIFLFLFSLFLRRIEDDTRSTNGEKRTPTDDSSLPITKDFIVDKRTCIRRTIA